MFTVVCRPETILFNASRYKRIYLIENNVDRKRIYANPSSYPNSSPNTNPKAQFCFRTDKMMSFFDQVFHIFWTLCLKIFYLKLTYLHILMMIR